MLKQEMEIKNITGTLTLTPSDNIEGGYYAALLDSDLNWIANVYWNDEEVEDILNKYQQIKDNNDFLEWMIGYVCENLSFILNNVDPYQDLCDVLNEASQYIEGDESAWNKETIKEYTNRIGNTYFIVNSTEI